MLLRISCVSALVGVVEFDSPSDPHPAVIIRTAVVITIPLTLFLDLIGLLPYSVENSVRVLWCLDVGTSA
ncbi:hypothetical protein [Nocardia abscessus]|uniref:hypothetical protein n=1 Tax=Nocardia abscessus TaxID=120957 RepID=UPI0024572CF1|nr:hypothetical protein [Nocardia abscessus]